MKRSFRGFLSLLAVCAIAATFAFDVAHQAVHAVYAGCRAFKRLIVDSFQALATTQPGKSETVPFVRARAFVLRIAKRERPVVTASWRMCPSV